MTDQQQQQQQKTGRVSLKFSKDSATSASRKTPAGQHHHLGDPVLAPEEVLFSRRRAPQRYAEKDPYFAHDDLPDGALPDSDLLKSVHGYTSRFYDALGRRRRRRRRHEGEGEGEGEAEGEGEEAARGDIRLVDERSMDGTALLAFGVLLEEAAREALGTDGDMVFTEGVEDDEDEGEGKGGGRKTGGAGGSHAAPVGFEGDREFWRRKYAKRRKVTDGES